MLVLMEQGRCPDVHPARLIDPAIFQSLRDTGPWPPEQRRLNVKTTRLDDM